MGQATNRTFEDDPRFGLIVLSEIADKALSPGVNDPGTAIDVIGTLVRLFTLWQSPPEKERLQAITTGSATMEEMRTKPEFVRITNAGMRESHVHDVTIAKETPNYRIG